MGSQEETQLETMRLVKSQTGIADNKVIQDAIDFHHGNVLDAICALVHGCNASPPPEPLPFHEKDPLAQLRDILNEKEAMYYAMMGRAGGRGIGEDPKPQTST
jgi:hypothetical protein